MEQSKFYSCACGQIIECDELDMSLKNHIRKCHTFRNRSLMSSIFYEQNLSHFKIEELRAARAELSVMTEILTNEIQARERSKGNSKPLGYMQDSIKLGYSGRGFGIRIEEDLVECSKCKNQFGFENIIFLNECSHTFCKRCLSNHIVTCFKQAQNFTCLICPQPLLQKEMIEIIGASEFHKLGEEALNSKVTECINCKEKFFFEPGNITGNLKDEQGRKLTNNQELHYAQNRFKCPNCKTEQCRECKATPYHLGKTCDELKKFKQSKLCKYCNDVINNYLPSFSDICNRPECANKAKLACTKTLPCGDSCCGYKNEKECLPCLQTACATKNADILKNQKGDDYCLICYTEGLINAPCIQAKCGHIFHLACITTRIEKRWHRPRITFSFCLCPACKSWLEFPEDAPLQQKVKENRVMFEDIRRKSMERLKYEKRDKDERLHKPGDQYYNKPDEYAVAIYSYYQCFKCKNSYFGGLKSCENLMEEEKNQSEFKPEELICAPCSSQGMPLEKCSKHGTEFIEFKCKFCCSVAQWFCWGNTHFCDQCHQRQVNGDYVSKKSKSELPKCKGKAICPLKVDHKENGEEFALGCSLCRNLMNSHDF